MDPVRNPFAPGAGSKPPELAGRDEIIQDANTALARALQGRPARSQLLLGLRGTGKTVLLNTIEERAESEGYLTAFIEAPEEKSLAEMLYPTLHQALRKLSLVEEAKHLAFSGMRALKSFASVFKIEAGNVSISVDAEAGAADSGDLEFDLAELFIRVGQAARAARQGVALCIDEVQYLRENELAALVVAIHRINQKNLPLIMFGAGLPQLAALSGDAKSYAERLFTFPAIGALQQEAARLAIRGPIVGEEEEIEDDALELIVEKTEGYPYFLQEWGYQAWNVASESPIRIEDVELASKTALNRLDDGFFKVRFNRLTPKEREYVIAMAELGKGPYRSADVAERLGEPLQKLGPRRAQIINKGMIYSPEHGDIAFTVPMFEDFLMRSRIT
ncbi:MAG: ATP-binding protein [Myxococcota bacterium]